MPPDGNVLVYMGNFYCEFTGDRNSLSEDGCQYEDVSEAQFDHEIEYGGHNRGEAANGAGVADELFGISEMVAHMNIEHIGGKGIEVCQNVKGSNEEDSAGSHGLAKYDNSALQLAALKFRVRFFLYMEN